MKKITIIISLIILISCSKKEEVQPVTKIETPVTNKKDSILIKDLPIAIKTGKYYAKSTFRIAGKGIDSIEVFNDNINVTIVGANKSLFWETNTPVVRIYNSIRRNDIRNGVYVFDNNNWNDTTLYVYNSDLFIYNVPLNNSYQSFEYNKTINK